MIVAGRAHPRLPIALIAGCCLFLGCGNGEADRVSAPPSSPFNGHKFALVKAGEYSVGAEGHERNPRRIVHAEAFEIALFETTNKQFARFVKSTGYVTEAEKRGAGKTFHEGLAEWEWETTEGASWRFPNGPNAGGIDGKMDHPVVQVSWRDAVAYCRWAGGRLPSIVEWEIAARAGSVARYPWGDSFDPKLANTWNGESHKKNTLIDGFMLTAPVGSFPPNALGLYDVIGNVFEFCSDDVTHLFPGSSVRLRTGRGGSWWCSSSCCDYHNLVDFGKIVEYGSFSNLGFRMARDIGTGESDGAKP